MARVATRLGLDDPPLDASAASAVITANASVCGAVPGAISPGSSRSPPLPLWMRPAYGVLFASAVDLLPRECAVDLGLLPVWSAARPAVRASNSALLTTASMAVGWRPTRHALRHVARRTFAGR